MEDYHSIRRQSSIEVGVQEGGMGFVARQGELGLTVLCIEE